MSQLIETDYEPHLETLDEVEIAPLQHLEYEEIDKENDKEKFWGIPNKYMEFLLQLIATFATIWVAWKGYRLFGQTTQGVNFLNKQLVNNTITDIKFTNDTCPFEYSEIDYGSYWPGTSEGCFCPSNSSLYNGYFLLAECGEKQKEHNCVHVDSTKHTLLSRWRGGKKICVRRDPDYNFMHILPSVSKFLNWISEGHDPRDFKPDCNEKEKICGSTLCVPLNSHCPIIDIEISQTPSMPNFVNSTIGFESDSSDNHLFIYKNNYNSNISLSSFFPLVDIFMSASVICPNADSVSYNFPANFILAKNEICDADSRFIIFDSLHDGQFYNVNNFTEALNEIHYEITTDSMDWHLNYVKAPGLYYINCLQQVYPGDPVLINYYTSRFINFLSDAPYKTGLTVLLQKMTFVYALVMGLASVILNLIFLIANDCKYDFIACFKGKLAEKAKKLLSIQIFVEMFVVYGGTAALSMLIIRQSNVYKQELEEIQTTNCLDLSTKTSFIDLFNAVDSNQDSNLANIAIFSIAFLFIVIGKCLVVWREWAKSRKLLNFNKKNKQFREIINLEIPEI